MGVPSVLPPDLAELDDRDWAEARRRLALIEPVLEKARLPRSVMAERAREGGVEVTTLCRWARAFRTTGLLSSLLPYALALKTLSRSEGTIGRSQRYSARAALGVIERGTEQITGASLERLWVRRTLRKATCCH